MMGATHVNIYYPGKINFWMLDWSPLYLRAWLCIAVWMNWKGLPAHRNCDGTAPIWVLILFVTELDVTFYFMGKRVISAPAPRIRTSGHPTRSTIGGVNWGGVATEGIEWDLLSSILSFPPLNLIRWNLVETDQRLIFFYFLKRTLFDDSC